MLKVMVLIIAALLAITGYLYHQRSTAVLYRYVEAGDPVKEPAFAIFNPFRDRSPERSAEAFLTATRAGQCAQAMSPLVASSQHKQEVCEREQRYPLVDWRLANRTDQPDRTRMYYRAARTAYEGYEGQLWVTLEKSGEDWKVVQYECFY